MTARAPRRPTRTEVLVALGLLVLVGGVVQGYVFGRVGADERELVVGLRPGITAAEREEVRTTCGRLPGVAPVPDAAADREGLLERFPLRFSLAGATGAQEAALQECVLRFPGVRGVTTEGRP